MENDLQNLKKALSEKWRINFGYFEGSVGALGIENIVDETINEVKKLYE